VSATVELACEAEAIREALARQEDDPRARLADIETQLERLWNDEHARLEEARTEYERVLALYEPARDEADKATDAFVAKVTRAAELRRELDKARRKAGLPAPPTTSVRASRDRAFRELRQDARLAGAAVY
jgi:hypothetical protein